MTIMPSALNRTSRISRVSIVGAASVALLALTGCGSSDTTEETCERLDVYIDEMEDLVPEDQENNEDMANSLREMTDGMKEIRDDAGDEELVASLDSMIESYETIYTAFDDADDDQASEEILWGALEDIDMDALGEAGEHLDSTCEMS